MNDEKILQGKIKKGLKWLKKERKKEKKERKNTFRRN